MVVFVKEVRVELGSTLSWESPRRGGRDGRARVALRPVPLGENLSGVSLSRGQYVAPLTLPPSVGYLSPDRIIASRSCLFYSRGILSAQRNQVMTMCAWNLFPRAFSEPTHIDVQISTQM